MSWSTLFRVCRHGIDDSSIRVVYVQEPRSYQQLVIQIQSCYQTNLPIETIFDDFGNAVNELSIAFIMDNALLVVLFKQEWVVGEEKRLKYQLEFQNALPQNGKLSGSRARHLFSGYNVSFADLAKIWQLSDRDNDSFLSEDEYILARYLIEIKKQNQEIPEPLPDSLLQSVFTPKKNVNISMIPKIDPEKFVRSQSFQTEDTPNQNQSTNNDQKLWAISKKKKKRYQELFDKYNQNGYITGTTALELFSKSGLDKNQLASIWRLVDTDKDGKLDRIGFFMALHFIRSTLQKVPLPESIPQSMKLSITNLKISWDRESSPVISHLEPEEKPKQENQSEPIVPKIEKYSLETFELPNVPKITSEQIHSETRIGQGAYSVVWKGTVNEEIVAIKELNISSPEDIEAWYRELYLMAYLHSHDYVVKLKAYCITQNKLTIVMEFMEQGSIYDLIHNKKIKWSKLQKVRVLRHVVKAIKSIHDQSIIHRDLKSMNILVDSNNVAKLADLGCSRIVDETMTIGIGSPLWMAPEVVHSHTYSFPSDIYSFGVVAYEVLNEKKPNLDKQLRQVIIPQNCFGFNIIKDCTQITPEKRPFPSTIIELLSQIITNYITITSKKVFNLVGDLNMEYPPLDDHTNWYKVLLTLDQETFDNLLN